jgi:hypothetical protein
VFGSVAGPTVAELKLLLTADALLVLHSERLA